MFGRMKQIEDEPDWREKLADLTGHPLWSIERPSWVREPFGVILLGLAALGLAVLLLVGAWYTSGYRRSSSRSAA